MDIIGVYSNPFIDGDKAVILLCQPHKFRHGHTAAQRLAICKGDVKIVGACDDGSDLVKEYPNGLSFNGDREVF